MLKSHLVVFLLFFSFFGLYSQETPEVVTLTLEGVSLPEALEKFTRENGIRVYYQRKWFSDEKLTKEYKDLTPEAILSDLLQDTEVNLYRYDPGTFVLTRNNIIYDQLPQGFFGPENDSLLPAEAEGGARQAIAVTPVFVGQGDLSAPREVETIRVGRQNLSDPRESFLLSGGPSQTW